MLGGFGTCKYYPTCDSNRFVYKLETALKQLEDGEMGKAIIDAVSILPEAIGTAFTVKNMQKEFICNEQLDPFSNYVPSLEYLLHTYRGNLKGTCLDNRADLVRKYLRK